MESRELHRAAFCSEMSASAGRHSAGSDEVYVTSSRISGHIHMQLGMRTNYLTSDLTRWVCNESLLE